MAQDVDATHQTFGITTSKDMLDKLRWEFEQARRLKYLNESKFSGLNLAWTAYHTLDWIAVELVRHKKWHFAVANLGLRDEQGKTTDDARHALQDYATDDCVWMLAAEQIANAGKHRERRSKYLQLVTANNEYPEVKITVMRRDFPVDQADAIYGGSIPFFGGELIAWLQTTMKRLELPT